MSEWRRVPIGAVAAVRSGFSFKSRDWQTEGVPVVKITNVRAGRVDLEGCSYVSDSVAEEASAYLLDRGDILITMSGEIGSVGVYRDAGQALLNQRVGRFELISDAEIESGFLAFALQNPRVKAEFVAIAYGAAQPNISPTLIGQVEIDVPDLQQQRRIAAVLRCLDDLIENNRRRIALLEQMAQAIYREWFVMFRYHGHSDDERIDSPLGPIPDGWEVAPISEVVETLGGGTPSKKEPSFWDDGTIIWFTPSDLTKARSMFVSSSDARITPVGLARSSARLFPARSVLMTSRATLGVISISTVEGCTNQGFIVCVPNERLSECHLYFWLLENVPEFVRLATGATFKEITRGVFRKILIAVPPTAIEQRYVESVRPVTDSIERLLCVNEVLRHVRDILLPRLVTGEIDVSRLDLGELRDESAAA